MSYTNIRRKFFYVLVMELLFVTVSPSCFSDDASRADVRARLNIYSAHYAERGCERLGAAGYGEFLDFSFGLTNSCSVLSVEKLDGTNHVWQVSRKLLPPYRGFDDVALYHDGWSRRLFKVVVSREFCHKADIDEVINTLKSCSRDCDNWLGIKVPVAFSSNYIDAFKEEGEQSQHFWSSRMEDSMFAVDFDAYRMKGGIIKVEITVESKRVRRKTPIKDGRNEIEVHVEDF